MDAYLEDFLAIIGQPDRENTIPWLYKDSVGKLTVGKGTMLPTLEASQALQWYMPGEVPATPDQIRLDWNRVFMLPKGYAAAHYHDPAGPYLLDSEIDMQAEVAAMRMSNRLSQLPWFDALPDPAKLALMDMSYNLGYAGLLDKFPKMMAAVKSHDWPTAIEECNRPQLSATRNSWTRSQFARCI
jgi:GH24 family phage-related lysozyme (muramidase)